MSVRDSIVTFRLADGSLASLPVERVVSVDLEPREWNVAPAPADAPDPERAPETRDAPGRSPSFTNADLPAQWLVYITVEDLDDSMSNCEERGGKILVAPKDMGTMGRYCVIQDPAGAVAALFEPVEIRAHAGHDHGHEHQHEGHEGGGD